MFKNMNHASLSGLLMVAGTAIGAGMIGLPVALAQIPLGLIFLTLILVWVLMLLSAHYFLEVSLQFPLHDNLISLTRKTFGPLSALVVSFIYLVFLYALMGAYLSGSASLLRASLALSLEAPWALLICSLLCATIVRLGPRVIDKLNKLLMLVLLLVYVHMIYGLWLMPAHISEPMPFSWSFLSAVPIMITSFGFHLLIPSLTAYLNQELKPLKQSLQFGSFLAFIIYSLWIGSILQIMPRLGPQGLINMTHSGNPAELLAEALSRMDPSIGRSLAIFSFCALCTSLLGVALGLFDFILDGLSLFFKRRHLPWLALLFCFGPPMVFVFINPHGFLASLRYAAACSVILLCVLPISLCLAKRRALSSPKYRVWGGDALLIGSGVVSCCLFFLAL